MVQLNFNAQQHAPSTGAADVLETGVYSVQIVSSEVKETKAKTGYMLVLGLSCLDQGFAGRKLTARLNIHNPNPQAVEIAYAELSAISHVVGILNWQDTQQLHGRPFKVSVEKEERNDKPGSYSNSIKAYMDYAGNPPNPNGGGNTSSPIPSAPSAPTSAPAAGPATGFAPDQNSGQPPASGGPAPWQTGTAPATGPAPGAAGAPVQNPAAGAPGGAPAGGQPWNNGAPPADQQPPQQQPWNNAGAPTGQAPQQQPWQNQQPAAGAPAPAAGGQQLPWQQS